MKKIITYGTFDLFHIGHLELLRRLSELADYLVVGVSTDEFNLLKGKRTVIPYEQRVEIVKSVRYVDKVIPEESWEQKTLDIKREGIDIFAIGDDWDGKFDYLKQYCQVRYLPRTKGVSTTQLKATLNQIASVNKRDVIAALEVLQTLLHTLE